MITKPSTITVNAQQLAQGIAVMQAAKKRRVKVGDWSLEDEILLQRAIRAQKRTRKSK